MATWRDNGPIIISRELRRWSNSPKLAGGPLRITRIDPPSYQLLMGTMRVSFRDGRGLVAGVMWPDPEGRRRHGTSSYRQRAGSTQAFDRYRERRARAMRRDWLQSDLSFVERDDEYDVRAFLVFGSYVKAVRNILALAQMSKEQADPRQSGQGYVCLDASDRLPLSTK